MFDSIWLDIAIGLITVFFVFSLVTSGVRELFAAMLAARSTHLWNQLSTLLDAAPTASRPPNQGARTMGAGTSSFIGRVSGAAYSFIDSIRSRLRTLPEPEPLPTDVDEIVRQVGRGELRVWEALYAHPFVRQLDLTNANARLTRLSHIPPEEFARTMLDLFVTAGQSQAREKLDRTLTDLEASAAASGLDARVAAASLRVETLERHDGDVAASFDELRRTLAGAPQESVDLLARVERAVVEVTSDDVTKITAGAAALLPESARDTGLGRIVNQLVSEAAGAAEHQAVEVRTALSTWFDSSMAALSRTYRSRTRVWSFIIGLVVVAVFNVDTFSISSSLYTSENTRLGLVSLGSQLADEIDMGSIVGACASDQLPEDDADDAARVAAQRDCIAATVELVSDSGLPIGWELGAPCRSDPDCGWTAIIGDRIGRAWDNGWWPNIRKLTGWVLTAAALGFGAPFWFDVLKRATGIREKKPAPA